MEKYITTRDKKEVKFGDYVEFLFTEKRDDGVITVEGGMTLSKNNLEYLIKVKAIKKVALNTEKVDIDGDYVLEKVAKFYDVKTDDAWDILAGIYDLNEIACRSIIYKILSVKFNACHKQKQIGPKVVLINSLDNRPFEFNTEVSLFNKKAAYFNNQADANQAVKIANSLIEEFRTSDGRK